MGTRILTLDFIVLCLFSGSKLGSPVTSEVTRRQSRAYFVDCERIFTPILRTWVQKSTLLLQNRWHAEVLKKTPSSAKYVTRVRPPSVPESPPPPPPPPPPPAGKYSRDQLYGLHSISIHVFGLLPYQTIEYFGTVITKYSSNVSADVFQSIKHFSALMLGLGHCMTTCRKYSII